MATHNVIVPNPMEKSIEQLVDSGRYQNFSEAVRAGLRLLLEYEAGEVARLEALRNATRAGIAQLEAGDFDEIDVEDVQGYLERL